MNRISLIKKYPKNWLHKAFLFEKLTEVKSFFQGRLLDVGCAEKPYEELYSASTSDSLGVDHLASFHSHAKIETHNYLLVARKDQ